MGSFRHLQGSAWKTRSPGSLPTTPGLCRGQAHVILGGPLPCLQGPLELQGELTRTSIAFSSERLHNLVHQLLMFEKQINTQTQDQAVEAGVDGVETESSSSSGPVSRCRCHGFLAPPSPPSRPPAPPGWIIQIQLQSLLSMNSHSQPFPVSSLMAPQSHDPLLSDTPISWLSPTGDLFNDWFLCSWQFVFPEWFCPEFL